MTYPFVLFGALGLIGVAMTVWGTLRLVLLRSAHHNHTHPGAVMPPQSLIIGVVLLVVSSLAIGIGSMWP
ncbi:hypothetical protein ABT224_33580 [Streptomyces sp. NPDC001584]|uniref:hypothetical protein n=1 Tax=Streptomyces sp. NPDC001584 TaxID=3154521 RepID=UPI0033287127